MEIIKFIDLEGSIDGKPLVRQRIPMIDQNNHSFRRTANLDRILRKKLGMFSFPNRLNVQERGRSRRQWR